MEIDFNLLCAMFKLRNPILVRHILCLKPSNLFMKTSILFFEFKAVICKFLISSFEFLRDGIIAFHCLFLLISLTSGLWVRRVSDDTHQPLVGGYFFPHVWLTFAEASEIESETSIVAPFMPL